MTSSKIVDAEKAYDSFDSLWKECRVVENQQLFKVVGCQGVVSTVETSMKAACKNVEAAKDPSTGHCQVMSTHTSRRKWLISMQAYFDRRVEILEAENETCTELKTNYTAEKAICDADSSEFEAKKKECTSYKTSKLDNKCLWIGGLTTLCPDYDTCYEAAVEAYANFTQIVTEQIDARKLQYRMLKRLECLAAAWTNEGVDKKKIGGVRNGRHI